jgi:hypothetical protein
MVIDPRVRQAVRQAGPSQGGGTGVRQLWKDAKSVKKAAHHGLDASELPIAYETKEYIVEELTKDLHAAVQAEINSLQLNPVKKILVEMVAHRVERAIMKKVDKSIDTASLAAASVIMPRLAKLKGQQSPRQYKDWRDFSNLPLRAAVNAGKIGGSRNVVAPEILSGLGEGTGEDVTPDSGLDDFGQRGGGGFAPEFASQLAPEDFSALEHGRENLPAFDMSPKQKAAYAQQQLDEQLNHTGRGKPGTRPGTAAPEEQAMPEEQAAPPTPLERLQGAQQDISNQLNQVRGRDAKANAYERYQNSALGRRKHTRQQHQALLKSDAAYLKQKDIATGGTGGGIKQSLQRKAMYYMGLKVLQKYGEQVGSKLKANIKSGKFSSFFIVLILAIVKDAIDLASVLYLDPGLTGMILNIFISIILTVVLLGEGVWFKRWFIKRFLWKLILGLIFEEIPYLEWFPTYTVSILLMGAQHYQAYKKQKAALKELEGEVKGELRKAAHSQTVNIRHVEKIERKLHRLKKTADAH